MSKNKDINDLIERKSLLVKEADEALEKANSDEELKECDDKLEEIKSLDEKIEKLKSIESKKAYIKELKAKAACEDKADCEKDADDIDELTKDSDNEEDKIEEKEKNMSINSFNINSGALSEKAKSGLNDAKYGLGRKALNSFLIKNFGSEVATNLIAEDIGSKSLANSMVKSGLTSVNQPLVPQEMQGFISLLTAEAVVRSNAKTISTAHGNRSIPRMRLGASANWQGEGQTITPSAQDFDQIQLSWYKLTALTYTTLEFNNFSYIDLTQEITSNLAQMMALTEDRTFLLGDTGTYSPSNSLVSLAKNTFSSSVNASSAVDFQTISNDLAKVKSQLESDFVSTNGAVVFGHPAVFNSLENTASTFGVYPFRDEIRSGYLNGFKIVKTAQIPTNDTIGTGDTATTDSSKLFFAQPKHLLIGDSGQYAMRSTMEGGFVDGGAQVNTFGQDMIAWKMSNHVDFNVEHPEAIVALETTGWTNLNVSGAMQNVSPVSTATTTASGAIAKK